MGATTFYTTTIGKFKSVREAYHSACSIANEENGHREGYSGDIQTTSGCKLYADHPRYGSKAYDNWVEKITDVHEDARGDCAAIEITGSKLRDIKKNTGYAGRKGIRVFHFFGWCKE